MPYHFFFSHARYDTQDGLLKNFYDKLQVEVSSQTGDWEPAPGGGTATPGEDAMRPGFRDARENELGEWWEQKLDRALRTSRTFIAICSPTYVRRSWCGREWQYFLTRVQEYHAQHGELSEPPPLIIPINWVTIPAPPAVVGKLQGAHESLGDYYARRGLRRVMIDKPEEFGRIVGEIADRITTVSQAHLLPNWPEVHQIKDVTNPFPADAGGPREAQFVYLVGRGDEFGSDGTRKLTGVYGKGPEFWKPYDPPDAKEAARAAWDAAARLDHDYFKLEPDDQLADAIIKARDRRRLVVLMVDPWTLRLPRYKDMIAGLKAEVNAFPVIAPWNDQDEDTRAKQSELRKVLEDTFEKVELARSADELRAKLVDALKKGHQAIVTTAKPRPVEGTGPITIPNVSGTR
jgi:FxsC-like protein